MKERKFDCSDAIGLSPSHCAFGEFWQGSRARGEQYRGAAIANRHFFTARHGEFFQQNRARLAKSRELLPAVAS